MSDPDASAARRLVVTLAERGVIPEPRAGDADLRAVRITAPDGAAAGWFVGFVVAERLIGFAQLDEGLRFRRYSSFAGTEPSAGDWLDPSVVVSRAREEVGPGPALGEPYLSFDASPDRLAWVVPATEPGGRERRVFVAGNSVFERSV